MDTSAEDRVQQLMSTWISDERAMRLLGEARAEAEADVKAVIKSAMKVALLQRVATSLEAASEQGTEVPDAAGENRKVAESGSALPTDADCVWYVYGVTWAHEHMPIEKVEAVDPQHPAERIRHDRLAAVASRVQAAEFTGSGLHDRARELSWIEAKVRAHNAVLTAAGAALVPFRFGAVFESEAAVRQLLEDRQQELIETLSAVEGRTEWAAKVFRHPQEIAGATTKEPAAVIEASPVAGAGRAYLRQKQQVLDARRTAQMRAVQAADESCRRLAELADKAIALPLQKSAEIDRQEEMLLHVGYLLPDSQHAPFQERADMLREQLRSHGLLLEITGPWPPYNFVRSKHNLDAIV